MYEIDTALTNQLSLARMKLGVVPRLPNRTSMDLVPKQLSCYLGMPSKAKPVKVFECLVYE
jgi:hypothetical protein